MIHNNLTTKIALATLILAFAQITIAQADQNCALYKSNMFSDTKKLVSKLSAHYKDALPVDGFKQVSNTPAEPTVNLFDNEYHKIDRSLPFLNQFNSVGVVTTEKIEKGMVSYGTSVLISPCHVLVNRHAAKADVGSKLYVSMGQATCESKSQFSHMNIEAEILAKGMSRAERGIQRKDGDFEQVQGDDWAILGVKPVTGIKPAVLSRYGLTDSRRVLMTGYPYKELSKDTQDYTYLRGVVAKPMDKGPDGTVQLSDSSAIPGGSGSGAFLLGKDKNGSPEARLSGIHIANGVILQTVTILEKIGERNPKLLADIEYAISTGTCR